MAGIEPGISQPQAENKTATAAGTDLDFLVSGADRKEAALLARALQVDRFRQRGLKTR